MKTSTTLSVIMPVFDEQFLVQASLSRLRVLGESSLLNRIKVVVVDDCSTDETPAVLDYFQDSLTRGTWQGKFEWKFIRHQHKQGKGAALRTGLEHADTELTVFHDADLEYHPSDLLKMIPLFLEQDADAVFGSRFLPGEFKRALFFRHALGNRLLTFLCDLVCDLNLTDIETCYKMVRTELLKSMPLESTDFRIEPELTIKLAKRGACVFEVPISYSGRTYREGKKVNWRDGVLALWAILKYAVSDRIYTGDEHGGEILARLSRAPRFTSWMADVIRPYVGNRVFEIGAGIGNLTVNLIPRSAYWATDINPLYLKDQRHLSKTRPYMHTALTDVTRPESFPSDQRFDTVICLNVIEHVENDVAALKNIYDVLAEGGRAIILVPQGPGLFGTLDQALGHCRRYTREQLTAVGEQVGFRVLKIMGFNRAGVPAWWLNGRLLKRKTFGLWQIKLLNLLVPLFRKLEGWLPLQHLSLITVFEKAENLCVNPVDLE
jgi:glycosyltransferase involved in cell wall biosynthesis